MMRTVRSHKLMLEVLEARDTPAVVVTPSLADHTIYITGDANANTVKVGDGNYTINVYEQQAGALKLIAAVPYTNVPWKIHFQGMGGNDHFENWSTAQAFAFGGSGNDYLMSNSAGSELHGGIDNDTLELVNGAGKLFGDGGNDVLQG